MGMGKQIADATKAKVSSMENRLSGVLKPIAPRTEFINGLGHRIQTDNRATFMKRITNWHFFAILAASLVSIAVLIAVTVRAVLALIGKRRSA
jgi:hypothetical protein